MYLPSYLIAPDTFNPYNNPQFPQHHQQSLYSTLNLSQSVQNSLCGYCCPTTNSLSSTSIDLNYYQNQLDQINSNNLLEVSPSSLILNNFTEISLCENNLKHQQHQQHQQHQFFDPTRRTSTSSFIKNRSIHKENTMVRSFDPQLQLLNYQNCQSYHNNQNINQLLAMPSMFYLNTHNPPATVGTYLTNYSPFSYNKVHAHFKD